MAVTLTRLKSYKACPSWAPGHNCSPAGVRKEFPLVMEACIIGQMHIGSYVCLNRGRDHSPGEVPGEDRPMTSYPGILDPLAQSQTTGSKDP